MPVPSTVTTRRPKPQPGSPGGRLVRMLAWPTVILWALAIVLLHPLAGSLYQVTNHTAAANLPSTAPSTRVAVLQAAERQERGDGPGRSADTLAVLFVRTGGLTATDRTTVAAARAAVAHLVGQVDGLGSPGTVRAAPDGQAVTFTAVVSAPALRTAGADIDAVRAVRAAVRAVADDAGGLDIQVTGPAAVTADTGSTSQTTLLLTAVVIVAVILLIVYRSLVLWIFPLIGALGGIVVAQAATHALGTAGLTISSLSTSILIVLAFGAASDYALLLIHRYRDELRHRPVVEEAMAVALRRTLPTLAASAATVIGAMVCLLAARSASLHGLGPVGAIAVLAALLAQISFLPAMLVIIGRAAFWPRPPRAGDTGTEESRVWADVGVRVSRHPVRVALWTGGLLVVASLGLLAVHIDDNPLSNVRGHPESVTGAALFAAHFGPGATAPLTVLAPPPQAATAARIVRAAPEVAAVSRETAIAGYAAYSVVLAVDPYSAAGTAAVGDLRQRLDRSAPGTLVGGDPAIQYDIGRAADRDALVLIPLVLVVIFLVVAALLRALVAPLVLVGTTALSFAAALGLANLLWRFGLRYPGIEAQLPLYIFIFLVALGVDYNIFLTARIREEARTLGTRRGTIRGVAVTGGVITAAGIVLAGTFTALTTEPQVNLTVVGTAIAIGVMLDTLLVRTVLVPAAFLILGDTAWWPASTGRPHQEPTTRAP